MLGAQARAAELQAAKSAAMRQKAHQGAGEQSVPLKPTPMSLTDFARNPLQSKNKGIKAFRPLSESDFDRPEDQTGLVSISPDQQTSPLTTPFDKKPHIALPDLTPTAPRAMLPQTESNSSRPTPLQLSRVIRASQSEPSQAGRGGLCVYDGPIPGPSLVTTGHPTATHVFGPDDLSPTKQETKFAERQQHRDHIPTVSAPIQKHRKPFTPEAKIFTPQRGHPYEVPFQYQDIHTQLPFDPYMYNRPQIPYYRSETGTSSTGLFLNQSHLERTQSFANDVFNHQNRLQQQVRVRSPPNSPQPVLENDQPYDRHSKMQSFVAAQQAMARKGKTVLRNPDLHRSLPVTEDSTSIFRRSTLMVLSPPRDDLTRSISHINKDADLPKTLTNQRARQSGPPSGVETSHNCIHDESAVSLASKENHYESESPVCSRIDSENPLPERFRSEDWRTLRPITAHERDRLRRMIKEFGAEGTICTHDSLTKASANVVGLVAREWVQDQLLHRSRRHSLVEDIVQGCQKRMELSSDYGVIGRPVSREKVADVRCSSLKAVAHIMAAIYDCAEECEVGTDLTEYTLAPEHAIDGDAALQTSGSSLFDDHAVTSERP